MKEFTTAEIRDLLNRVMREEISFSEMVEALNYRMGKINEPQYKNGDFVVNVCGVVIIFKNKDGSCIYDHAYFSELAGVISFSNFPTLSPIERYATEEEKQKMLDALTKRGKRWNEEEKCIEDIQVRKFKIGDKVRIKHGVSSKTHDSIRPYFAYSMDELIGKELTVEYCDNSEIIICDGYAFLKEWLEPYEGLKKGDLAIFWDNCKKHSKIGIYKGRDSRYIDHDDSRWLNVVKLESKEQFLEHIKK